MHVKLVVVDGDVKTSEVRLKIPAIIGRGRGASLQIPQALVSRQHCELTFADGKLKVRDLGSLNGTVVEGKKVTEAELVSGQTLTIGSVTFRVEFVDPAGSSGDWKATAKAATAGPAAQPGTPANVMFVAVGGEPAPRAAEDPSGSSTGTRKGLEEITREPWGDGRPSSDVMSGFEGGANLLPPLAEPQGAQGAPPAPAARHFVPPAAPVPPVVSAPPAVPAPAPPVPPAPVATPPLAVPPLAIPVATPAAAPPAATPPIIVPQPAATLPPAANASDDDDDDLRAFLQSLGK